jgi:hypothetical protein
MLRRTNETTHAGDVKREPGANAKENKTSIGNLEPLLSLAVLRRFIPDIIVDTSNEP